MVPLVLTHSHMGVSCFGLDPQNGKNGFSLLRMLSKTESIWVWVKNRYTKWNPGKWTQRLKPAVPLWLHFDPYPYGCVLKIWLDPQNGRTGFSLLVCFQRQKQELLYPQKRHAAHVQEPSKMDCVCVSFLIVSIKFHLAFPFSKGRFQAQATNPSLPQSWKLTGGCQKMIVSLLGAPLKPTSMIEGRVSNPS